MKWLRVPLGILFAGSLVCCGLNLVAIANQRRPRHSRFPKRPEAWPFISVLKPLAGADEGLFGNLQSFFQQDYPEFELLLAVRSAQDAAVPIVRQLQAAYPRVSAQLLITGESSYPNAKVFSLQKMTDAATGAILLVSDSDVRVVQGILRRLATELADDAYDLATCPYRAEPGSDLWSTLEALGMNSEFWPGVLTAKLVEGVRFTVGPTTVAKKSIFDRIPPESLQRFLAEDFVLGQKAAELGMRVDISQCVVEHRLGTQTFRDNLTHRIRWARSSRCSRPAGYVGQVFTFPLALALLFSLQVPSRAMTWVGSAVIARLLVALSTDRYVLQSDLCWRYLYLLPIQDVLGFLVWLLGFWGNQIVWRGRRYQLHRDGTFELVS